MVQVDAMMFQAFLIHGIQAILSVLNAPGSMLYRFTMYIEARAHLWANLIIFFNFFHILFCAQDAIEPEESAQYLRLQVEQSMTWIFSGFKSFHSWSVYYLWFVNYQIHGVWTGNRGPALRFFVQDSKITSTKTTHPTVFPFRPMKVDCEFISPACVTIFRPS